MSLKKPYRKHVEKLKLYLAKQNDTKRSNKPGKNTGTKPQANQ